MNTPEKAQGKAPHRPAVKFVVGIEDIPCFHWRSPILAESFRDKPPFGGELLVMVCNNHRPLSEPLIQVFQAYGIKYFTTTNYPKTENMELAGNGDCYSAINRIQALSAVAESVAPDALI